MMGAQPEQAQKPSLRVQNLFKRVKAFFTKTGPPAPHPAPSRNLGCTHVYGYVFGHLGEREPEHPPSQQVSLGTTGPDKPAAGTAEGEGRPACPLCMAPLPSKPAWVECHLEAVGTRASLGLELRGRAGSRDVSGKGPPAWMSVGGSWVCPAGAGYRGAADGPRGCPGSG